MSFDPFKYRKYPYKVWRRAGICPLMPIFPANPKENTTPPLHSRLDNKKKTRKNYDSIFENNATFLLSGIDLNLTKVASNFLAFSDLFWG